MLYLLRWAIRLGLGFFVFLCATQGNEDFPEHLIRDTTYFSLTTRIIGGLTIGLTDFININQMKKTIFTTTLFLCSILIVSCSDGKNGSPQNQLNQANTATSTKVNSESTSANQGKLDNTEKIKKTTNSTSSENISITNKKSNEIDNDKPRLGTIKDMRNGDLKCYVTVVDENGKLYENVGASFDICEPDKYVNKKVEMYYQLENVNDCQSSEPCGKTIKEWLITKIEIQD